jgi:hypothetical protein
MFTPAIWERFAAWIDGELRARELQPGPGYTFLRSSGGYSLNITAGSAPSAATPSPFDVTLVADSTGANYTATIRPGTVNGILPSNMFSSFSISASATTYFKAVATTDGKQVTSVSIVANDQAPAVQVPVPQALPAGFQVLFAVAKAGNVFRTLASGNIAAAAEFLFTANAANWSPGKPMTENWYHWRV